MTKLFTELQRLYFLHDQQWHGRQSDDSGNPFYPAEGPLTPDILAKSLTGGTTIALNLLSPDGMTRAMAVNFAKPADWEQVANLYRALQDELDLPAPAISVSGRKGYRLWFSLDQPVPAAQAHYFLDVLCRKYLADIPASNLQLRPDTVEMASGEQSLMKLVPARHRSTGKWSAFIDPSLGAMFIEEPGLEMAPNMDSQAHILAGLESIKAAELQRAIAILEKPAELDASLNHSGSEGPANSPGGTASPTCLDTHRPRSGLSVGNSFSDPQSFLLAVMNDSSASPRQRIEAAKALLPYFAKDA